MTLDRLGMLRARDREETEEVEALDLPDLPDSPEWPQDAPREHRLLVEGVTTDVWQEDRERLGHVLMVEYDDEDPGVPLRDARALPGLTVLLRSSRASYHLWDLMVRDRSQMVEEARETDACPGYLEARAEAGHWALRTSAKVRETDLSHYREPPEPVRVIGGSGPVSAPHLSKLRDMSKLSGSSEVLDRLRGVKETHEVIGESFATKTYKTMTDELEGVWFK